MSETAPFAAIREHLRAALESREARRLTVPAFQPAAVLVALLDRAPQPTVLFTWRGEGLRHHRGQVAFPGGALDSGESPVEAALREAWEEVGLDSSRVAVLGTLDDQPSISSFLVTPVVAAVADPPARFETQEGEVVRAFEVPLGDLFDPSRMRFARWGPSRVPGAVHDTVRELGDLFEDFDESTNSYKVWFFDAAPHSERQIWGLTARILKDFLEIAALANE